MSDVVGLEEIVNRIGRLEEEVDELRQDKKEIQATLHNIDKTLIRLNLAIEGLLEREGGRKDFLNKVYMFIIGSFIAALITFISRGGLDI